MLPADFQFSQGSLQDYVDCPRRFELRYVRRLRWPAVEVAPPAELERHLQQGAAFHRLIHQHLLGLPVERLSATVVDPDLRRWWRDYLEGGPVDLPSERYPEVGLSTPVGRFRLVAQMDLVAVDVGERAVIVDWKTNRKRPSRESLADRLQTCVYPYLLVRAGAVLNGGDEIRPRQVTMLYWFANAPAQPERFEYDRHRYRADHGRLTGLIGEIEGVLEGRDERDLLPRTDERRRCRYCLYRSFCRRGGEAGLLDEVPSDEVDDESFDLELDLDFDLEQIAEADVG
ncbi:MAG: PD-(D/E)XK nuclease family protein [Chloroflexota bacterium]|nr:PD-(D/E)XK nuclease family protein [Chloroflexota bacterium]